jgi:uncharacterized membrane protein YhiD involved in acid resistance
MGGMERITTLNVVVNVLISFLVGMFIFYIYKKTYQGVLYQKSFNVSLVLAAVITSLVIMTISGNLVLSLGMVGALSIVRFRTPIKDSMDLIFLFWAISTGIANGVGYYNLSVTGSFLIAIMLIWLTWQREDGRSWLLVCRVSEGSLEKEIIAILKQSCDIASLKSKVVNNQYSELIYELRLPDASTDFVEKISALHGIEHCSLVVYEDGMTTI